MRRWIIAVALIAASRASALEANDAVRQFYKGRQITIVTDSSAGAYEAFARDIASFLPKYIPGEPKIIVENKPGAGGVVAANYLYNIAPKDGTVLGGLHGNVLTAPILSPTLTRYDPTKFSWIANLTKDTYVGYVMKNAPIQRLEEAKTQQVILGGTSVGGAGIDMAIIARDLFGFKFKIVSGYRSSADVELALSRGELQGTFAHALSALRLQKGDWIRDDKITLIVQHGFARDPSIPDVPLLLDFATTKLQRQVLAIETVRQTVSKPYLAPPGVPADRLQALRAAFQRVESDPGFLAQLHMQKLELNDPMNWEELEQLERRVMGSPSVAVATLRRILGDGEQ